MTTPALSMLPTALLLMVLPFTGIALAATLGRPDCAPAESAAVASTEWAAMRAARAAGDRPGAVAHAARAHAAWPGQWVYAYGLASVAATAGDASRVRQGLSDLAALGVAPDLTPDSALVRFARTHFPQEIENLERIATAGQIGEVAFRFPEADSMFWPEGIAFDAERKDFYVTGVREGRVVRVDSAGRVHPFSRVAPTGWAALGVAVDTTRDRIWVGAAALPQATGYVDADSGRGAILAFDRSTGREIARFDLPFAKEGHVPGDVLVTPQGDVLVSDSGQPVIWRIRAGRLDPFATDPGFRSLQGQALGADGRWIYVADYSHGLAAVDLTTAAVTWLCPLPGETALGIDGLARHPTDGLIAVQNGLFPPRIIWIDVMELDEVPRLLQVVPIVRDPVQADEPTMLAVVNRSAVYIANSLWEKHDDAGRRRLGTRVSSPLGLVAPVSFPLEASPDPQGGTTR